MDSARHCLLHRYQWPAFEDEYEVRRLGACLWLARRFPEHYRDVTRAQSERQRFNALIEQALRRRADAKAGGTTEDGGDPRRAKLREPGNRS